jgi:hypothetical protein
MKRQHLPHLVLSALFALPLMLAGCNGGSNDGGNDPPPGNGGESPPGNGGSFSVEILPPVTAAPAQPVSSALVDRYGRVTLLYLNQQDGSGHQVVSRHYDPGTGQWLAREFAAGGYFTSPQARRADITKEGEVFLAWWTAGTGDEAQNGVRAARYVPTQSAWTDPALLATFEPAIYGYPTLGSDDDGNVLLTWIQSDPTADTQTFGAGSLLWSAGNQSWSDSGSPFDALPYDLLVRAQATPLPGTDGRLHAFLQDQDMPIRRYTRNLSGDWSGPVAHGAGAGTLLAAGNLTDGAVGWLEERTEGVYAGRLSVDTMTLSDPVAKPTPGAGANLSETGVALTPNGQAAAAWYAYTCVAGPEEPCLFRNGQTVFAAAYEPQTGWQAVTQLAEQGLVEQVVGDAEGNTLVVWRDLSDNLHAAAHAAQSSTWTGLGMVRTATEADGIVLVRAPDGTPLKVWSR